MATTQNVTTQGTVTPAGVVNFNPNTGQRLSAGQSVTVAAGGNTYGSAPNTQSTTTLTSDKATDIAKNTTNLDSLSNKGITTDAEGNQRYSDNSFVPADTSKEDASINSYLDQMKASLDATTKAQIDNIQQKFAQREQEQQDINKRSTAQVQNALLMGGATGQGSSAQYAPVSSVGIVQSSENYGVKQIAALNSQENDLIAQARAAQQAGDFQIMEKRIAQVEEVRKAKIDAAAKLNDLITARNEEMKKQNLQIEKEQAIGDLYDKGVTDTREIMSALKTAGVSATAKEVGDTVALFSGIGGTGIVGEYNFYKSEAKRNGQVPVDFNTYQNMDANRKKSIAAAGVAGNTGITSSGKIVNLKPLTEAQGKDFTYAQRGELAKRTIDSLENDIVKMSPTNYELQKRLETSNLASGLVSNTIRQIRQAERDFATAVLRRESGASISPTEFATAEKQYFPRPGDDATTLANKKKLRDVAIQSFKTNVPGYQERSNASTSNLLIEQGKNNPLNLDVSSSNTNNPLGI